MEDLKNYFLRLPQIAMLSGLKRHTINARVKTTFSQDELLRTSGNQILLSPTQIKKVLGDRLINCTGKVIYVGNLKGGVGKTTISYIIANVLSTIGFKTCCIDLDTQSNLTHQYTTINSSQPVFQDVINNEKSISEIIVKISPTLDIIPSSLRNSLIQKTLSVQQPKHHLSWFNDLCLYYLRENYDIILVDTPPHLTTLNSVFCLCLNENDHIIIPACAEDFSVMGVQMFLDDILDIRKSYKTTSNPNISIVINRFFQTQKTNLEMLLKISQAYSGMLSEIIIKDSAKIRETILNRVPIGEIKQGKEIYEIISNLLQELKILKKRTED